MASLKQRWPHKRKINFIHHNFPGFAITLIVAVICFTSCETGISIPAVQPGNAKEASNGTSNNTNIHDEKMDAGQILSLLKAGNESFVRKLSSGNVSHDSSYNYFDQIRRTGSEQHPVACILTCMDSRVPPEIIFEQGIGSLFVLRVAGNIEDDDILGSMEYAVAEKHVPLVIVMGHKNCGAIAAAFSKIDPENKELVSLISLVKKDVLPNDKPPYDASARHNVKLTEANILKHSAVIKKKYDHGELMIVGALYDVSNGKVDWDDREW